MNNTAATQETFETQTCTRCGGSGKYSYCAMYGTTCFKCSGSGKHYSKRGQSAIAYMNALRTVKVTEIQVGWLWFVPAGPFTSKSLWHTVTAVKAQDEAKYQTKDGQWHAYYTIESAKTSLGTFATSDVMAVASKERLTETRQLALQYQSSLRENGRAA